MIETTQILFFAISIILTFLLVILGWKMYQVFSELLKLLQKANHIMDGAISVTDGISKSVEKIGDFSEGIKTAFRIVNVFKHDKNDDRSQRT